jgi:hypothetical protein
VRCVICDRMKDRFGPISHDVLLATEAAEVPCMPGIYIWRRVLRFDPIDHPSHESMEAWVRRQAELPIAVLPMLQIARNPDEPGTGIRPGYAVMRDLRIGAARLPMEGLLPTETHARVDALTFLSEMTKEFGPALYVGESEDLQRRVREHVSGSTGFSRRVEESGLQMSDLVLSGVTMGSSSPAKRRQLEFLLTHLVGAPLTRKAGK